MATKTLRFYNEPLNELPTEKIKELIKTQTRLMNAFFPENANQIPTIMKKEEFEDEIRKMKEELSRRNVD